MARFKLAPAAAPPFERKEAFEEVVLYPGRHGSEACEDHAFAVGACKTMSRKALLCQLVA